MRRRFFLFAAPAIVAAPSLMRVSAAALDSLLPVEQLLQYNGNLSLSLNDLIVTALRYRSRLFAEQVRRNNAILRELVKNNPHGFKRLAV